MVGVGEAFEGGRGGGGWLGEVGGGMREAQMQAAAVGTMRDV